MTYHQYRRECKRLTINTGLPYHPHKCANGKWLVAGPARLNQMRAYNKLEQDM